MSKNQPSDAFANGTVYIPAENLFYAFSLLIADDKQISYKSAYRLRALADLVETVVLSENIVFDSDQDIRPIDVFTTEILNEYKLNSIILGENFSPVSLKEHSLRIFSKLRTEGLDTTLQRIRGYFSDHDFPITVEDWISLTENFFDISASTFSTIQQDDVLDFIKATLPVLISSPEDFLEVIPKGLLPNSFQKTWVELSEQIQYGLLDSSQLKQQPHLLGFLAFYFQGGTESALTLSLRNNLPFFPNIQQSNLILSKPFFAPSSKVFFDKLNNERYAAVEKLNDFFYENYSASVRLPILFDYIVSKADNPKEIFEVALDIREKKETRRYKAWCKELDETLKGGLQQEAIKLVRSVNDYIEGLMKPANSSRNMQVQISFPPAVIFDLPLSDSNRKNHLVFLRHVYEDLKVPTFQAEKIRKIFKIRT